MKTIKYAFRNVCRAKGRSILIGIIVIIIAFAVCIALCIRQSAEETKSESLDGVNITAQISIDREAMMASARESGGGEFDKSALADFNSDALSLEELETYAKASSVQSFYYTLSASVDGAGSLEAYSTSSDSSEGESSSSTKEGRPSDMGGAVSSGDFVLTGYSSDEAMTDFTDGTCTIEDGQVFEEGTDEMECIISNELAEYNSLKVGDTIKIASTEDDSETYTLIITGIYSNSQASAEASGGPGGRNLQDPANYIYMSYEALNKITSASDTVSGSLNGTYVLGTLEAYEAFQNEVKDLGLSDDYTVSSSDVSNYERTSQSVESLASFAGYFLIVILGVGAVILIVLNIFATRERKYEIGILSAIGMKKGRVARLFISEILIITLAGVIIGGGIGAAVSVPASNAMLSVVSSQTQEDNNGFGREMGGKMSDNAQPQGDDSSADTSSNDGSSEGNENSAPDKAPSGVRGYITDISASVNITVLLEMLGICMVLALISGMVSVVAIMRYEPLEILSNRD